MTLNDLRIEEVKAPKREHHFKFRGTLMSFDQSLGHTGWVYLVFNPEAAQGYMIWSKGRFDSTDPLVGHEASIKRSIVLHNESYELIMNYADRADVFLCELPPLANRLQRPESSLVAAAMLHLGASRAGRDIEMISAQQSKKIWTGNGNAKKELVKQYLLEWSPDLEEYHLTPDQLDATANGLAWAELHSLEELELAKLHA